MRTRRFCLIAIPALLCSAAAFGQQLGPPAQPVTVIGGSDLQGNPHAFLSDLSGSMSIRTAQDLFAPPYNLSTGVGPRAVTLFDVDGDGHMDIVLAERASANDVRIWFGNGDGTFVTPPVILRSNYGINRAKVADFNGDQVMDIAGASPQGYLVVWLGTSKRSWGSPTYISLSGANARGIDVGPMGNNGYPGIAVGNFASNNIFIVLGNGDGTFQTPVSYSSDQGTSCSNNTTYGVQVADFNGDGIEDVFAGGGTPSSCSGFSIWLGNQNGTLNTVTNYPGLPLEFYGQPYVDGTQYTAIGDVDNDGLLDVAWANASGLACVARQIQSTSQGGNHVVFDFPNCTFFGNGNFADAFLADVNGDHFLDFLLAPSAYSGNDYQGGQGLQILFNVGNGKYSAGALYSQFTVPTGLIGTIPHGPYGVAAADLNGDGIPDVVYADTNGYNESLPGQLYVFLGTARTLSLEGPGNPELAKNTGEGGNAPPSNFSPRHTESIVVPANGYAGALDLHTHACLQVSCTDPVLVATGPGAFPNGTPTNNAVSNLDAGTAVGWSLPVGPPYRFCLGTTVSVFQAFDDCGIAFKDLSGDGGVCSVSELNSR